MPACRSHPPALLHLPACSPARPDVITSILLSRDHSHPAEDPRGSGCRYHRRFPVNADPGFHPARGEPGQQYGWSVCVLVYSMNPSGTGQTWPRLSRRIPLPGLSGCAVGGVAPDFVSGTILSRFGRYGAFVVAYLPIVTITAVLNTVILQLPVLLSARVKVWAPAEPEPGTGVPCWSDCMRRRQSRGRPYAIALAWLGQG